MPAASLFLHYRFSCNPPCFAEQNANPLVSRGFYSLFCGAKCEPSGEQRILLLVLRSKMRLPLQEQRIWLQTLFSILNTFADQITHLCGTDLCDIFLFIFFLRHDVDGAVTVFQHLFYGCLDGICLFVKVKGIAEHHCCA